MQKITPCLWFEDNAEEAVNFYTATFSNASILETMRYGEPGPGVPGSVMTMTFVLEGLQFIALNGGPYTTFTPATSFFVTCGSRQEITDLWDRLADGGEVLMPLDTYPFSAWYGWVQDRFGVSWQLYLGEGAQKITPCLMFVGTQHGKAEEAMQLYASLFESSGIASVERYGAGEGEMEGSIKHARFTLHGQEFIAMDGGLNHDFTFTPAVSFFVNCADQPEVDHLWESLGDGGEFQQCGWLQDRCGVTWQIVPNVLLEMLQDKDTEKASRVNQAMLQMIKIDVRALEAAYLGS